MFLKLFIKVILIVLIFEALFLLHAWQDAYQFGNIDGIGVITVWATVLTVVFLVFSVMGLMNIDSRIKELNEIRERLMEVEKKVVETEKDFKLSAEQEKKNVVKKAQEQIVEIINKSAERQNTFDELAHIANIPDPDVQIKRYSEILKTKTEKDGVNVGFVHIRRGEAYQIMERDDEALADFEQAVQITPNDTDPYLAIGCFYVYRKKDYAQSIKYFEKALKINPKSPQIYVNIANSYAQLNNFSEADKYYKLADDYSVESFNWYYNKANILRESGEDPKGELQERYLKYCLKLNPLFIPASLNLSSVYKSQGRPKDAEKLLTELINTQAYKQEFINSIIQRGECSIINGNYAGALNDFNLAYVYRPSEILTLLRLSQLNLRYSRLQLSLDFARIGIKQCQLQNDNRMLKELQEYEKISLSTMKDLEKGMIRGRTTS